MIDIDKLEKTIDDLEKSSKEFSSISRIVDASREILDYCKDNQEKIDTIKTDMLKAVEKLNTLMSELYNMNSQNMKIFNNFKDEIDININRMKLEIFSNTSSSLKENSVQINQYTSKKLEKSTEKINSNIAIKTDMIIKEVAEQSLKTSETLDNNSKKNKIYFFCNLATSCITIILIFLLLFR